MAVIFGQEKKTNVGTLWLRFPSVYGSVTYAEHKKINAMFVVTASVSSNTTITFLKLIS